MPVAIHTGKKFIDGMFPENVRSFICLSQMKLSFSLTPLLSKLCNMNWNAANRTHNPFLQVNKTGL